MRRSKVLLTLQLLLQDPTRSSNESQERRRRVQRSRSEFGMSLHSDVIWMICGERERGDRKRAQGGERISKREN
jgi:hypothetical protein